MNRLTYLTYEEQSLIACFNGTSRDEIIADIESKLSYLDDEMKVLAKQTLQKIKNMTNMEFDNIVKPLGNRL